MTKVKTWSVLIEEEGEDLILPFPQEMLDEVGWKEMEHGRYERNKSNWAAGILDPRH